MSQGNQPPQPQPQPQYDVHTGDKSIVINANEIVPKLVIGLIAVLIAIVSFFGRDLYSQVQSNTSRVNAQEVVDARLSENVKHLSDNIDGLKRAIEQLIDHEAMHRSQD